MALTPDLTAWRRYLHAHPELSFQETETATFIRRHLSELGIEWTNPTGNSTVGILRGRRPGKTVAVRADIDALPITEENDFGFVSTHPGVMHACGHDGHTAILLGVARLLAREPDFSGTVKLLFQEAEEMPPGGAKALVEAGVLEDVDHVIGLHLMSDIPTGRAGIIAGPMTASADFFDAKIIGLGGHGASPHQTIDAVVAASSFVMNLQTVVARKVDPLHPAVISVGTIQSGFTYNVIAPSAEMKGTVRAYDESTRQFMQSEIQRTLEATCAVFGARSEYQYTWGYPATVNHRYETEVFQAAVRDTLGADALVDQRPVMGGEDFSYYALARPGAFLFLGCRSEAAGSVWPHHHPRFTIDEAALPQGVEVLTRATLKLLG